MNVLVTRTNQYLPLMATKGIKVSGYPECGSLLEVDPATIPQQWIPAIIQSTGPTGTESNYTDNRYWVKLGILNQGSTFTETSAAVLVVNDATAAINFTATNVSEGTGSTHALAIGTAVMVTQLRGWTTDPSGRTILQWIMKESSNNSTVNTATVAYLTQIGGANGDDGTASGTASFCTYTYNAYFDSSKTQLAGGTLTVQAHRDLKIAVTAASLGLIQKNGTTSTYQLMAVLDEYRDRDVCAAQTTGMP